MKDDNKMMVTTTKKLVVTPVYHEEHKKRVEEFFEQKLSDGEKEVERLKESLKKEKRKKEKDKNKIDSLTKKLEKKEQSVENTKKNIENINDDIVEQKAIKDYACTMVRDACESEAIRKNITVGRMISLLNTRKDEWVMAEPLYPEGEERKGAKKIFDSETSKLYREEFKKCTRKEKTVPKKKNSVYDGMHIKNPLKGYGTAWSQELDKAIRKSVKNGVLEGREKPIYFKKDSPVTIAKQMIGFSSNYPSLEETLENWGEGTELYFDLGSNAEATICNTSNTIAKFKIDLGDCKNKNELLATLRKVYMGEYIYCGSSMKIVKNKIVLMLTLQFEKQPSKELDEDTVVGVDLGLKVSACCAVNNSKKRKYIGCEQDISDMITGFENQRKRHYRQASYARGGHGRRRKLKKAYQCNAKQRNSRNTYNHGTAKKVVKFALENNAKYIHLEHLEGITKSNKALQKKWTFYDLQQKIKYKAEKHGIIVRMVNPCYTSQICSKCGEYHKDNRESQSEFVCKLCGHNENADYNAAKNISMMPNTLILSDDTKKKKKTMLEEARMFYGIEEEKENPVV